jgi:hypothetical protein
MKNKNTVSNTDIAEVVAILNEAGWPYSVAEITENDAMRRGMFNGKSVEAIAKEYMEANPDDKVIPVKIVEDMSEEFKEACMQLKRAFHRFDQVRAQFSTKLVDINKYREEKEVYRRALEEFDNAIRTEIARRI